MSDCQIILTTINAKHVHCAFGLRYLFANMGDLQNQTQLIEFDLKDRPILIAEKLLTKEPSIIGFGVYIWNRNETLETITLIKKIRPDIKIILGGPEVSHNLDEQQSFLEISDIIICGEADLTFRKVCQKFLYGEESNKVIKAELPDLNNMVLPYQYYSDHDLTKRIIYVEISRGCPYSCEFCLSSLDEKVRCFDTELFLGEMDKLLQRGCKTYKFVDRTFNLNIKLASKILKFFLDRNPEDIFLHFEMVPDRLPEELKELIKQFPVGSLQFEIGIQSFDAFVGKSISRKMNLEKTFANLKFLNEETHVHLHADLIIGLPGDTPETFSESFNQLWQLKPHEIQVGILKRLKGTPIIRHTDPYQIIYNQEPPFDILQSKDFSFEIMQKLKRFARYYEVFANSGRFEYIFSELVEREKQNAYKVFFEFSSWLWETTGKEHAFSLKRQFELVYQYCSDNNLIPAEKLIDIMSDDFLNPKTNPEKSRNGLPNVLRSTVEEKLRRQLYQT